MHQRKAEMSRCADAFVALPGGYGTLEELFEVITWAQLSIHSKPVGLLNVDGYFDPLLAFVDKAVAEGFIPPHQRRILVASADARSLLRELEEYVPVEDAVTSRLAALWEALLGGGIPDLEELGLSLSPNGCCRAIGKKKDRGSALQLGTKKEQDPSIEERRWRRIHRGKRESLG